jgi:hypothetical protein
MLKNAPFKDKIALIEAFFVFYGCGLQTLLVYFLLVCL